MGLCGCIRASPSAVNVDLHVLNGTVQSVNDDEPLGEVVMASGQKVSVDGVRREGRWSRRAFLLTGTSPEERKVVGAVVQSIWPFGARLRPERPLRQATSAAGELVTPWEASGRLERAIEVALSFRV